MRLRVREEVARFNASSAPDTLFRGLVRPSEATETAAGFVVGARRLDWEAQADAACAAFLRNGFVMLAGERQIEELDEPIDLRHDPEITFIRLVPLVGG